jgi:hypothetical protein
VVIIRQIDKNWYEGIKDEQIGIFPVSYIEVLIWNGVCSCTGVEKIGAHCVQEMLNSYRKFVGMKICYWKFEGNLNTHVPLWAQQHMVNRHYSLNLKPWSARTLYVYHAHADLAQNTPLVCRKFLSPGCAPRKKILSSRPVRLYDHVLAIVFVSIDPLFTAWNLSHL